MVNYVEAGGVHPVLTNHYMDPLGAVVCSLTLSTEDTEPKEGDAPLDDAARGERDYVRSRLREELKREPTDEELDDWLRRHTEGY